MLRFVRLAWKLLRAPTGASILEISLRFQFQTFRKGFLSSKFNYVGRPLVFSRIENFEALLESVEKRFEGTARTSGRTKTNCRRLLTFLPINYLPLEQFSIAIGWHTMKSNYVRMSCFPFSNWAPLCELAFA